MSTEPSMDPVDVATDIRAGRAPEPPAPKRRRTGLIVTAAVLVAALVGVGVYFLVRPKSPTPDAATESACRTLAQAQNQVIDALHDWEAQGRPSPFPPIDSAVEMRPTLIGSAITQARGGAFEGIMADLSWTVPVVADVSNDDQEVAAYVAINGVLSRCVSAGADVTISK